MPTLADVKVAATSMKGKGKVRKSKEKQGKARKSKGKQGEEREIKVERV